MPSPTLLAVGDRRLFATLVLACVLGTVAAAGCGGAARTGSQTLTVPHLAPPPSGRRPNVVFVLTDDLSSDLLRFMPHVRALERRGTRFSRYVVSDSLCCPSRSSIFTGNYPHTTGVFTNVGPDGGYGAFRDNGNERSTVATSLHAAGYRTGLMGKYLNGYDPRSGRVPRGWDTWAVTNEGYDEYDYVLSVDGRPEFHRRAPADYLTTVLEGKALAFLDRRRADPRPFFLEVATFAPHSPAVPAPADRDKLPRVRARRVPSFDKPNVDAPQWLAARTPLTREQLRKTDDLARRRARSVLAVDRMLGALERRLVALGIADDTYVVFSSDNGFHTGQHELTPGKLTAFDHDIRVPLVVRGPGVAADRTIGRITQNVDLRPTFEAWAGARGPAVDGRSLAGLLAGRPEPAWRTAALVEHHGDDVDPMDPDEQSAASGRPLTYQALRTREELYVEYRDGERELYDLRTDPFERRNVVDAASPDRLARLHAEAARLTACRGAPCSHAGG